MNPRAKALVEALLDVRTIDGGNLGRPGYRGPFTQRQIAEWSGVSVGAVNDLAVARDDPNHPAHARVASLREAAGMLRSDEAPRSPRYQVVDARTVRGPDGQDHDVLEAIATLPWVRQRCPQMPHEYVHRKKADPLAWAVLETMVKPVNPASYRAYFRGYQSPNRYWEAPDGLRYWSTGFMLNRCEPDSVDALRRVDQGAKAIKDWDGPRFAPNHSDVYERDSKGRWWPTAAALAGGYAACTSCKWTHTT